MRKIIDNLGRIRSIFRSSSRASLILNGLRWKNIEEGYGYWIALDLYLFIILAATVFLPKINGIDFLPVFIGIAAVISLIYLEKTISRNCKDIYREYGLLQLPFRARPEFLHYARFSQKIKEQNDIGENQIGDVVEWIKAEERSRLVSVFESAPAVVLMGGIVTLIAGYLISIDLGVIEFIVITVVLMVLIGAYFLLIETFRDFRRERLRICKHLEWHCLDLGRNRQT